MNAAIPRTMKAAALDHFGGPEVLELKSLPVPVPAADEVLIQLDTAGIGVWDPYVREGELELGDGTFPRVFGNDGAGTVVATGDDVTRFKAGDRVYAYDLKGGFYAEYVAVSEEDVAPTPPAVDGREAGALGADGITALGGLDEQLQLQAGETVLIFGASGGIGHIAVQLAKRMGAKVVAVASRADGVALVRRLGADVAVDGQQDDITGAIRAFAPGGLDAALVLVGGRGVKTALKEIKKGGRVAYPNGVELDAPDLADVELLAYDGMPSREAFERLNRLIGSKPFHVELGRLYRLEDAARAHRELNQHHIGKLAFEIRGP
jgi:NADPH:quinone reductase-like Zn-dependent oxidoreductase